MIRDQRPHVMCFLEFVQTLLTASKYCLNSTSISEVKGVDSGILHFFSFYGHFPILYLGPLGKNEIIR